MAWTRCRCFSLVCLALFVSTNALGSATGDGLDFLLRNQSPTGALGETTAEEPVVATQETLATLHAMGMAGSSEALLAEQYLMGLPSFVDSELEFRREVALASTAWARLSVPLLPTHARGFEAADPLHLSFALRAGRVPGQLPSLEGEALAVQLAHRQRASGCYGHADNQDSTELTAQVVMGLRDYTFNGSAQFASLAAIQCLRSMQLADGSWGSVADTAWAVLALLGTQGNPGQALSQGQSWLLATQAPDGSWGGSVRLTALTVRALATTGPDWALTTDDRGQPLLFLSNPEPVGGETVTASVTVENRAGSLAPQNQVRVYARAVGAALEQIVAQSILPPLAAGASAQVSMVIPTAQLSGRYSLRAAVDPDDLVPELNDFNNEAVASLNVRSENDLSVGANSIRFTSDVAGVVQIEVDVRNLGLPLPSSVGVDFFKGNPAAGGVKLGAATIPSGLGLNEVATVTVSWSERSANDPTPIFAVVDPEHLIAESDESNNQAFRFYFAGASTPVDLSVASADLSATPAAPRPGETFTFRAVVRNAGTSDVNRVGVSVFQQASPRQLLAQLELPFVGAGSSTLAETSLALHAGGSGVLVVEVDAARELNDTNRTNNLASLVLYLSQVGPPRELRARGLSSPNPTLQNGAPISLSFLVQNAGTEAAQTSVRLVDQVDGRVWATALLPLRAGETRALSMGPFTTPNRPAALKACVDPDDDLQEPNENDNCSELTVGLGSTDVSLHPRDVRFTPTGAAVGEPVQLAATVRNATSSAASTVVEWWLGSPLEAEGVLLGTTPIQVPAGGATTARFDWLRVDGSVEVFARLAQVTPADSALHNNLTGRHLFLEEIVDLGLSSFRLVRQPEVRVGRLSGSPEPELVVGYSAQFGPTTLESGVAMLQNAPGGYQLRWRRPGLDTLGDVALADLDGDGTPEVVQVTMRNQAPYLVQIDAIRPDGTLKWQQTFLGEGQVSGNNGVHLGVGDVNGDGVADIVFQQATLRVLSGDDGHLVFTALINGASRFALNANAVVLDVDGDGDNEILGANLGVFLLDHTGAQVWRNDSILSSNEFAVVDLDLDGSPEVVFPFGSGVTALDLRTGADKGRSTSNLRGWENASPSAGALRQDGLAYSVLGDNSYSALTMAYSPDLSLLWARSMSRPDYPDVYAGTLADVVGLGRPQLIANSYARAFGLQDGRDGRPLLGLPHAQSGTLTNFTYFAERQPVVADARGDGTSRVLVGTIGDSIDSWPASGAPNYGQGILVFGSPHWKKQPPTWPTRALVKGRIGDDLKVATGYRWWTTHNTWNQQFDVEPARTLADLELRPGGISTGTPLTAGATTTLSAVVHNVGGISASGVTVSFYDGAPPAGRLLGVGVAAGPLAPRGGTATASLPWLAYPEGEHLIYAVANEDGAIEESGMERNTATVRAFVGPGTQLCDVALDATSLAAQPSQPLAGQGLTLTATLRNLGLVACEATVLSVKDGSPLPAASTPVPALAPGAATTVWLSLVATPGTHLLRLTVDEAALLPDGDRANNEATLPLFVPQSAQPDLFASSLTLSPSPVFPDGTVQGALMVKNLGSASPSTTFRVTQGGTTVSGLVPPLRAGESASLAFSLRAPASTAAVVAAVDDLASVAEFNENNNQASASLVVVPSGLTLAATATPAVAGPHTAVTFEVTAAQQHTTGRLLLLDAHVLNDSGAVVAVLATAAPRPLGASSTASNSYAWNTGASPPGLYRLRVTARDSAGFVAQAETPLTVVPGAPSLVASLLANRGTVPAGGDVVLSFIARNDSGNQALSQLTGTLRVFAPSGLLIFQEVRQVGVLLPGALRTGASVVSVGRAATAGRYTATLDFADATTSLAQAGAAFDVTPNPETLVGALTAAAFFQVGAPLPVEVLLENEGAVAITGETLTIELVNVESGLAVESLAGAVVTVAAEASSSHAFALPTTGVPVGQKLLVARLGGRILDTRPITALPLTDGDPPRIDISGISDADFTNQEVRPVVSITDASAFTAVVMLDGAAFTAGDVVTSEGAHTLTVEAQDLFGNRSWVTVRFTIDLTAPVLVLNGPADGSLHLGPQTLAWTATDDSPLTTLGTVGALTITSGELLATEGDFEWTVRAEDAAGNVTTQTRRFAIDATAPEIALLAPPEDAYVRGPAQLSWTVTDAHPGTVLALLDGSPVVSPVSVTTEGLHTVTLTATDAAGNAASVSRSFTLDDTPPSLSVAGVADGAVTRGPVAPSFIAADASPVTVSATLDGAPFISGMEVGSEGVHELIVIAHDAAGNETTQMVRFTIDDTAPVIIIAGIVEGALLNTAVSPSFTVLDANPGVVTATLDGAPFVSGDAVTAEGAHELFVTAIDAAGNTSTSSVRFELDFTAPAVTISGVAEGALVRGPVTPGFFATDANLSSVSATLNGVSFSSGTPVSAEGEYLLEVHATDGAGNSTARQVRFTIDTSPPVIQVTGVVAGQLSATPLTLAFSATDLHLAQVSATLDGVPFSSGTPVTTEGAHLLVVNASDGAGNTSQSGLAFTLDFTAPIITISGVTDGATGPSFTPLITVTDAASSSITLDGAPFTSGTTVTASGTHVLAVTATDAAGNTATRIVTFVVVATGGQCVDLTLSAERRYAPSGWADARHSFSLPLRVSIPWTLDVTAGNAGNKRAYLFLGLGGQTTRCEYKGGSPFAHPKRAADVTAGLSYRLERCTNGMTAGATAVTDEVRLHVHEGDSKAGTTSASWRLQESSPCVGSESQDGGVPLGRHCGHERVACDDDDHDDDDDDHDRDEDVDDCERRGSGR